MKKISRILTIMLALILVLGCTMPAQAATKKTKKAKTYTVTFKDSITGKTIKKVKVKTGENAKAPKVPKHKGWKFLKWNKSLKNIKKNKTIKTVYYKNELKGCVFEGGKTMKAADIKLSEEKYRSKTDYDENENNQNMSRTMRHKVESEN